MRKLSFCMVLLCLLILSSASFCGSAIQNRTPEYKLIELQTLGGDFSHPTSINDNGVIVGYSRTKSGQIHATLWIKGVAQDLGTLGGIRSYAAAINNEGVIVGASSTNKVGLKHAVAWYKGQIRDLQSKTDFGSWAGAVSDSGEIAGIYAKTRTSRNGCVWYDNRRHPLYTSPGTFPTIYCFWDHGEIAGSLWVGHTDQACFWGKDMRTIFLPIPPNTLESCVCGGNAHHVMVGEVQIGQDNYPYTWYAGKSMRDGPIGTGPGVASAINDNDEIIGWISPSMNIEHAAIWRSKQWIDLNSLTSNPDWDLESADSINNRGEIIGLGTHLGQTRGYLLIPMRGVNEAR